MFSLTRVRRKHSVDVFCQLKTGSQASIHCSLPAKHCIVVAGKYLLSQGDEEVRAYEIQWQISSFMKPFIAAKTVSE